MLPEMHDQVVKLILTSMHQTPGPDSLISQFQFGLSQSPWQLQSMVVTVFFRDKEIIEAALLLRRRGPPYLKSVSVRDIGSMISDFVTSAFHVIGAETFGKRFEQSYYEILTASVINEVSRLFLVSNIMRPSQALFLYPLVPVEIESDFNVPEAFLIRSSSLGRSQLPDVVEGVIIPSRFPPLANWNDSQHAPSAWLGVRSPILQDANKQKSALLGAMSLTVPSAYRYQFNIANNFGGHCRFDQECSFTFSAPHLPSLATKIKVTQADHDWIKVLLAKTSSKDRAEIRQIKSLEYFYRSWPLEPAERCPFLYMALDALFGGDDRKKVDTTDTQVVIDGVREVIGPQVDEKRLRLLMRLRGEIIHGRAPDLLESEKYEEYWKRYRSDPIADLELVAGESIRLRVFQTILKPQPDPYATQKRMLIERGLMAEQIAESILG